MYPQSWTMYIMAPSVLLPTTGRRCGSSVTATFTSLMLPLPPSDGAGASACTKYAVRLTDTCSFSSCFSSGCWPDAAMSLRDTPPNQPSTTVMRFSVKVPVLSEQMVVALPMVSHAAKMRMKHLSAYIFLVEYAKAMVTANGRPSGMATTTMVTPRTKAFTKPRVIWTAPGRSSPRCAGIAQIIATKATNVAILKNTPKYPISCAILPSFSCSGVSVA